MKSDQEKNLNLIKALNPVLRYISWQHYYKWLLKGLLFGSGSAFLILLLARFFPIYANLYWAVGTAFVLLFLLLIRGFSLRPGYWEAALAVDKAGLKERVATAWQLKESQETLALFQREDALKYLNDFDFKKGLPWPKADRKFIYLGSLLLAVIVLSFWPNSQNQVALANHQEKVELLKAEEKVNEAEELVKEDKGISDKTKKELLEAIKKLQKDLNKAKSLEEGAEILAKSQKEITKKLNQNEEKAKLNKLAFKFQQNPFTKGAGTALQKRDSSEFQKQMEELAQKLKEMDGAEKEKLAKLLEDMANDLKKQGDSALAGDFQKAAEALSSMGQEGPQSLASLTEQITQQFSSIQAAANLAGTLNQSLNNTKGNMVVASNKLGSNASSSGNTGNSGNNDGNDGNGNNGNSGSENNGNSNGSGSGNNGSGSGNNGNGSGSGSGNGSGSGSGSGSGGGSGAGKSGNDAGDGSSNQTSDMNGKTNVGAPGSGSSNGTAVSREGHWDQIYVPSGRIGDGGQSSQLNGLPGTDGDSTIVNSGNGLLTGGNLLPYSQVMTQYEAEARESLEKEYIPDNYKDLVRDYFIGLSGE